MTCAKSSPFTRKKGLPPDTPCRELVDRFPGQPKAFNDLLHHMFNGGQVALLGLLPAGTGVDWDQIIFKGLELHGIYGRRMYETWYKMTQMVLTGFPLHKALTHHIPIDDFRTGFQLMLDGQCGKVVCDWTGEI